MMPNAIPGILVLKVKILFQPAAMEDNKLCLDKVKNAVKKEQPKHSDLPGLTKEISRLNIELNTMLEKVNKLPSPKEVEYREFFNKVSDELMRAVENMETDNDRNRLMSVLNMLAGTPQEETENITPSHRVMRTTIDRS